MASLPPPTPQPAVPQVQQQTAPQPLQSQQIQQQSASQQSLQTPQPAPPPLINYPVSVAAAAAIAMSAGMVNPSEWNALASSSMVILEDLRDAFVVQKKKQLRELQEAHKEDLRELLFMSETYDKDEVSGSPFKLPRSSMALAADDAREHVTKFLDEYELTEANTTSIRQLVLLQPKALRDRLTKELGTGPIESAPPPTPTTSASMASAVEAQKERERQKEQEAFNKAAAIRSAAIAQAAAAAQTKAQAEGVAKLQPLAMNMTHSQNESQASSTGGSQHTTPLISQLPMSLGTADASSQVFNIATLAALAQQSAIPAAASTTAQATGLVPSLIQTPGQVSVTSSLGTGAGTSGTPSATPSKSAQASSLQKAVSPAPGLAPSAASEAPGLHLPPSPTAAPVLPDTAEIPPLHPTLQKLAPNPLSVTYAASLRPLPPDPSRRITGAGIGGGAIHHRGGRKIPPAGATNGLGAGVGASGASIGPAGSGQTDLWRWYVRARASPGAGMVGKADKCLMTNDWKVAFDEQRFVRAMARIEKLKAQGEWSFRQPKKQKGPVVHRAHWDHLLDEMKWIQTDFREERRWKLAVAFQLAHEIAAWHKARTPGERASFCIAARGPRKHAASPAGAERIQAASNTAEPAADPSADVEMAEAAVEEAEEQEKAAPNGDAEKEAETDEAVSAAVDQAVQDADVTMADGEDVDAEGEDDDDGEVEAATAALVSGEPSKPPKVEVVHEPRAPDTSMPALASNAQDPTNPDQPSANEDDEAAPDGVRTEAPGKDATLAVELPPELITTLRAPIFSMDVGAVLVSPSALLDSVSPEAVAATLGITVEELPAAAEALEIDDLGFSKMFPELPLFGAPSLPDAASKSDRRWDEGSLNQPPRLTHVTKLLDSKPLLVSTLEPSKNRAQGRWLDDSDWIIAAEQSDPLRGMPDGVDPNSGIPPLPGSLLFARRSNKASREPAQPAAGVPTAPASPDARAAMFVWTPEEDSYLMTLAKQYNNNWSLISDLFNSTRLTIPTDRREAWDCYDRCKRIHQAAEEGKPPPGPPQLALSAGNGTPDKDKKSGEAGDQPSSNNSLAAKRDKLNKKLGTKYDGSRKKLRRANLMEVMRKSSKRREANKQAQQSQVKKVNLTSHETHTQIKAGPAASPQTLSALKQERDQAALRQFYEHQRAQLAFQQQQQQAQRMLAQQAQTQGQAVQGQRAGQPNAPQPVQQGQQQVPAAQQQPGQQPQAQAQQQPMMQQASQQQQAQPQQQAQAQQPQAQLNQAAQKQASQAAQMQNLYVQIQQQQQRQQQQQPQMVQQQRPPPLTQQQLQQLTPQQQQQYHAQLAAAAAAAQQQAKAMQFSVPQAQSQFPTQQQQQQMVRPPQQQQQQPQQQQQQFGGVRPLAAQQRPVQQQQQQQQRAMNSASPAPGQQGSPIPPGMPSTIQALQQQLAISLASSNLSPEQINGLAIQLFKQAQTSYGQQQATQRGNAASPRPMPQQQGGNQPMNPQPPQQ